MEHLLDFEYDTHFIFNVNYTLKNINFRHYVNNTSQNCWENIFHVWND